MAKATLGKILVCPIETLDMDYK